MRVLGTARSSLLQTMQRNALCSVIVDFSWPGTSVARVRWTANRYSASSRDGALRKREPGGAGVNATHCAA